MEGSEKKLEKPAKDASAFRYRGSAYAFGDGEKEDALQLCLSEAKPQVIPYAPCIKTYLTTYA